VPSPLPPPPPSQAFSPSPPPPSASLPAPSPCPSISPALWSARGAPEALSQAAAALPFLSSPRTLLLLQVQGSLPLPPPLLPLLPLALLVSARAPPLPLLCRGDLVSLTLPLSSRLPAAFPEYPSARPLPPVPSPLPPPPPSLAAASSPPPPSAWPLPPVPSPLPPPPPSQAFSPSPPPPSASLPAPSPCPSISPALWSARGAPEALSQAAAALPFLSSPRTLLLLQVQGSLPLPPPLLPLLPLALLVSARAPPLPLLCRGDLVSLTLPLSSRLPAAFPEYPSARPLPPVPSPLPPPAPSQVRFFCHSRAGYSPPASCLRLPRPNVQICFLNVDRNLVEFQLFPVGGNVEKS